MKRTIMLITLVIAFVCNGCAIDDGDVNFHFTALQIVNAQVPKSFDLYETYKISVNYLKPNSCTHYEGFDVVNDSLTTRSIVAIGAVRTDIDDCTEELIEEEASFNFEVIYTNPYIFKFYTGDNSAGEAEFIEIVVPVNKP